MRTYSELIQLPTFIERFRYLRLNGSVGIATFGFDRYLNQAVYQRSLEWKEVRDYVIARDQGCDLGVDGTYICDRILVHHMNPLTEEDLRKRKVELIFDPEYLITTSLITHNAIHYSDESILPQGPAVRRPNDTIPWR